MNEKEEKKIYEMLGMSKEEYDKGIEKYREELMEIMTAPSLLAWAEELRKWICRPRDGTMKALVVCIELDAFMTVMMYIMSKNIALEKNKHVFESLLEAIDFTKLAYKKFTKSMKEGEK